MVMGTADFSVTSYVEHILSACMRQVACTSTMIRKLPFRVCQRPSLDVRLGSEPTFGDVWLVSNVRFGKLDACTISGDCMDCQSRSIVE